MCFRGERRLGVKLRRARGVMGRDEGKIAMVSRGLARAKIARVTRV